MKTKKRIRKRRIICCILIIIFIILATHFSFGFLEPKPVMQLRGKATIELPVKSNYVEEGVNATYKGEDVSNEIQTIGNVDTDHIGEYKINYEFGKSGKLERTIKVIDKEKPKIELKGGRIVNLTKGTSYKEDGYEAQDNYDGDLTNKVTIEQIKVNDFQDKLIYHVTDLSGNEATEERYINYTEKSGKSVIYLTFDDGPSQYTTPKILDILKSENVPATFFILNYDKKKEPILKREVEEGHSIGIHGYSHEYKKIYKSEDTYMKNIKDLQNKIKESTGITTNITRFPGGSSNTVSKFNPGIMSRLSREVLKEGFLYYDWNVSSGDSGDVKTSTGVYNNVTKGLRKGRNNVVLMHDFANNKKTVEALRGIIEYGKKNGYEFKKITNETPMVTQRILN